MKYIQYTLILFSILFTTSISAQMSTQWTEIEIKSANTADTVTYLNQVEKECITMLNLARLYPKKFMLLEVQDYMGPAKYGAHLKGSKYKKSLIRTLNKMKPVQALVPDEYMTENAKCFAIEMGKRGYEGHTRKKCKKENYSECCSYGMATAKDIILQLLIDHDVPSLGHRDICLDANYTTVGVGVAAHKQWDDCCAIEFK